MKKVAPKAKKVAVTTSKKSSPLFLIGALAVSLLLLVIVLMAMGNSQDNRSDAARNLRPVPPLNLFKNAGSKETGGTTKQPATDTQDTTKKVGGQVEKKPYVAPDKGSR